METFDSFLRWARELIKDADSAAAFMEGFKLNLYHEEIYVYTPKGDMKTMPSGATPIDFAYSIHTEIGNQCIGAKVNGRIVRLNAELKSGDRVEIITSKNQCPKQDWLKMAVTHRAKLKIRSSQSMRRGACRLKRVVACGRKMLLGTKKLFSDNDIVSYARRYGVKDSCGFLQCSCQPAD